MTDIKESISEIDRDLADVEYLFYGSSFESVAKDVKDNAAPGAIKDIIKLSLLAVHTTKDVVYSKYVELSKKNPRLADSYKKIFYLKDKKGLNMNMTKFVLFGILSLESKAVDDTKIAKRIRSIYDSASPYSADLDSAQISEEKFKIFSDFKDKHPTEDFEKGLAIVMTLFK